LGLCFLQQFKDLAVVVIDQLCVAELCEFSEFFDGEGCLRKKKMKEEEKDERGRKR
jgi:hypothetical protein